MARLAQRNAFENGCVAFMVGSFVVSFVGVLGLFCGRLWALLWAFVGSFVGYLGNDLSI